MEIKTTKGDVIWSYLAQFFNMTVGLITLPLILKLLTAEEVGFNYILISINSIVVLFDMGFSGQFSRYLTYIFSGAQTIKKEGISNDFSDTINEYLLACTIATAKKIYLVLSLVAFLFLVIFGTWYVYDITDGLSILDNALWIWIIFSISSFLNIYYLYYNAFLMGRGLVKESKQAQVYSRIFQLIIIFVLLLLDTGLFAVVIANLLSPFVFRYYAYIKFYSTDIKKIISTNPISMKDILNVFKVLLYNAKKMGFISILSSALGYASTLVLGKFLSLAEVGSYGLMVQLVGVIFSLSIIYFNSISPQLANLLVKNDFISIRKHFGISLFVFYCVSLFGLFGTLVLPLIFKWFNFNTNLPSVYVLVFYYIYRLNEQNQNLYSQLFLLNNDLRFFKSAVFTGVTSFTLLCVSLYLGFELWGVVLSQAIPLYVYSAWKWPIEALHYYKISFLRDIFFYPCANLKNVICKTY